MVMYTSNAMMNGTRMLHRPLSRVSSPLRLTASRCLPAVFRTCSRHYATPFRRATPEAELDTSKPARTRFAPSPTGYLHIGSLRTALYNYLLARATGGQFLIRIEDTDRNRLVPDAEARLFGDLKWAGLDWDEGPGKEGSVGPYRQSDRLPIYDAHAKQLLDQGKAYRCFCKPEELDKLKEQQLASDLPPQYPGTCSHVLPGESDRRAANGEAHCVRFKAGDERPLVKDLVYGTFKGDHALEDLIIIKRDGFPTYHFANVVDDHLMEISHVIRGAEWLRSTPRHIQLYDAFGWTPPKFAHVALLVNSERQKLSKRHSDVDIASWRDKGFLPAALLNYVMLLGWSLHGSGGGPRLKGQKEVMDLDQMVASFHLRFTKGDVVVNDKHEFFQKEHMTRITNDSDPAQFIALAYPFMEMAVRQIESLRKSPPSPTPVTAEAAGGTKELQLAATVSELDLGELVPRARWEQNHHAAATVTGAQGEKPRDDCHRNDGNNDISTAAPYIQRVLAADRRFYKHAEPYVLRNRYLLWQIPRGEHLRTLQPEHRGFSELVVVKDGGGDAAVSARPVDLVRAFREMAARIEDWDDNESVRAQLDPYVKSLRARTADGTLKASGFHLVRWVVNALRPGPSLANFMAVLGRDEVMLRADQAIEVIEQFERDNGNSSGTSKSE
ncbi:glutamyl-tRNA synthetase [Microdochium nivale]|nr:glutamyl-tRNA synthetase [Microdochium nivale]